MTAVSTVQVGENGRITFTWRSRLGRSVATFHVIVTEVSQQEDQSSCLVRIIDLYECRWRGSDLDSPPQGPVADLDQLHPVLREEIQALIGTSRRVPGAAFEQELVIYTENPMGRST